MSAIATLKALLGLDTTQFKAGMKDAEDKAGKLQKTLANVGKAMAGAFTVGAVVKVVGSLADYADNLSEAADNAGVLTAEMAGLNEVATQTGLNVDEVRRILSKLDIASTGAAEGNDELRKKFDKLGLSVADLVGMGPAQQLEAVAKAALAAENPVAALADVFGEKMGPRMIGFLQEIAKNGIPDIGEAAAAELNKLASKKDWYDKTKEQAKRKAAVALASAMPDSPEAEKARADRADIGRKNREALKLKAAEPSAKQKEADKKEAEIRKDTGEKIAEMRLRAIERISSISGTDKSVDAMAQVGARIGSSRAGVGIADRQIKVLQESKAIENEILTVNKEMNTNIAELKANAEGGSI